MFDILAAGIIVAVVLTMLIWIGFCLVTKRPSSIIHLLIAGQYTEIQGQEYIEDFPDEVLGTIESKPFVLEHKFPSWMYSDEDVLKVVEAQGCRMATLREFLILAAETVNVHWYGRMEIINPQINADGSRSYASFWYSWFKGWRFLDFGTKVAQSESWFGEKKFIIVRK